MYECAKEINYDCGGVASIESVNDERINTEKKKRAITTGQKVYLKMC